MASKEDIISALRERMADPTITRSVFDELKQRVEEMEQ